MKGYKKIVRITTFDSAANAGPVTLPAQRWFSAHGRPDVVADRPPVPTVRDRRRWRAIDPARNVRRETRTRDRAAGQSGPSGAVALPWTRFAVTAASPPSRLPAAYQNIVPSMARRCRGGA